MMDRDQKRKHARFVATMLAFYKATMRATTHASRRGSLVAGMRCRLRANYQPR